MDVTLFGILVFFGVVLLVMTLIRKHIILGVFTGIAFLVLGFLAWNGLEYIATTTISTNVYGVTTVTDNYADWVHTIGGTSFTYTNVIGVLFLLFGLFLLLVSGIMLFSGKNEVDFGSNNGDGVSGEE